ncbi:NADAR family protein [Candidatus Uabimicrobium amorphum]|uniref:NADAR domain-containing protein n=1 Tax=Uabimicrobium amorphum TaxID=2596890 RepID=A0A5S9IJG4_UABAM|nr:NADAR family protein [Candidatus Uabimicrobium amorphum]BBM82170.1 hypothetical protein UABAM_00513 [Candidatus Uabimicrobium amorphum]
MDIRTVEQLIEEHNKNTKLKYVFFWGHTPKNKNEIDKSCFSNWFPMPFSIDGITYATAEHYMMAQKALLFNDQEYHDKIIQCKTPGEAKKFGRKVRNFDDDTWKKHRFDIVVKGCVAKFSQNTSLKDFLLQTGTRILVEASPRDRIWGIGLAASNEKVYDPNHWKGLNLLGFALMEARQQINEQ